MCWLCPWKFATDWKPGFVACYSVPNTALTGVFQACYTHLLLAGLLIQPVAIDVFLPYCDHTPFLI
jgi:hypothetical protein